MSNLYVAHNYGLGVNIGTSVFAKYVDVTDGKDELTYALTWYQDIKKQCAYTNDIILIHPYSVSLSWLTSVLLSERFDVSLMINLGRADLEKCLEVPCKKFIFEVTETRNLNILERITNVDCVYLSGSDLDYNLKLFRNLRNFFPFNVFMKCNDKISKELLDKKIYTIIPFHTEE